MFRAPLEAALEGLAARVRAQQDLAAEVIDDLSAKRQDQHSVTKAPAALSRFDVTTINESIEAVNQILASHNEMCETLDERREQAKQKLIDHVVADFVLQSGYHQAVAKLARLEGRVEKNEVRLEALKVDVRRLEAELVASARGAEAVNEYLVRFLGTAMISVASRDDGTYRLQRGMDQEATNLSEGERTPIAFSYFLASLQDSRVERARTIVYLDDPISSLDENHLFSVFAAIKGELADVLQLFVSTHNFGFFRMLSGDTFFREKVHRRGEAEKRASWFLMRRTSADQSLLEDLPGSLRAYRSEYHYLFDLASRYRKDPEGNGSLLGLMPNILRRILEIYMSFRVPNAAMDFKARLDPIIEDSTRSARIYQFVNKGSHGDDSTFLREWPQSAECLVIIADVFDCLETADPDHFEAMQEPVTGTA